MTKILNFLFKAIIMNTKIASHLIRRISISHGMKVGSRTRFIGNHDFGTEPYLITIGDDCVIANRTSFLTHDGAIQVPLIKFGARFDNVYSKRSRFGRITIGNNCFIGYGAILLPDTTIGNNTIVAAGSVVRGNFPNNVVIGGNPGKILQHLEEYESRNREFIINLIDESDFKNRKVKILESCPEIKINYK